MYYWERHSFVTALAQKFQKKWFVVRTFTHNFLKLNRNLFIDLLQIKKWWYSNWQCSQYLDLNPTCALVSAKQIISNAKLWQSEGNVVKNHQITPHAHKMSKWSPHLFPSTAVTPPQLRNLLWTSDLSTSNHPHPQELGFPMMNFAETLDVHQKATVSLTVVKVKDFYVTVRSN